MIANMRASSFHSSFSFTQQSHFLPRHISLLFCLYSLLFLLLSQSALLSVFAVVNVSPYSSTSSSSLCTSKTVSCSLLTPSSATAFRATAFDSDLPPLTATIDTPSNIFCWEQFPANAAGDSLQTPTLASLKPAMSFSLFKANIPNGKFIGLTCGDLSACALRTDNVISCWGGVDGATYNASTDVMGKWPFLTDRANNNATFRLAHPANRFSSLTSGSGLFFGCGTLTKGPALDHLATFAGTSASTFTSTFICWAYDSTANEARFLDFSHIQLSSSAAGWGNTLTGNFDLLTTFLLYSSPKLATSPSYTRNPFGVDTRVYIPNTSPLWVGTSVLRFWATKANPSTPYTPTNMAHICIPLSWAGNATTPPRGFTPLCFQWFALADTLVNSTVVNIANNLSPAPFALAYPQVFPPGTADSVSIVTMGEEGTPTSSSILCLSLITAATRCMFASEILINPSSSLKMWTYTHSDPLLHDVWVTRGVGFVCTLRSDQKVRCSADLTLTTQQIGLLQDILSPPTSRWSQISCSDTFCLGVLFSGQISGWGTTRGLSGQGLAPIPAFPNAKAISFVNLLPSASTSTLPTGTAICMVNEINSLVCSANQIVPSFDQVARNMGSMRFVTFGNYLSVYSVCGVRTADISSPISNQYPQGGALYCFTMNQPPGNLPIVRPPDGVLFSAASQGQYHLCGLVVQDGSVLCTGEDSQGQVTNAPHSTGFTFICASGNRTVALTTTGSGVAWGSDGDQLKVDITQTSFFSNGRVNKTTTRVVSVSCTPFNAYVVLSDGSVVRWENDPNVSNSSTISNNWLPASISAAISNRFTVSSVDPANALAWCGINAATLNVHCLVHPIVLPVSVTAGSPSNSAKYVTYQINGPFISAIVVTTPSLIVGVVNQAGQIQRYLYNNGTNQFVLDSSTISQFQISSAGEVAPQGYYHSQNITSKCSPNTYSTTPGYLSIFCSGFCAAGTFGGNGSVSSVASTCLGSCSPGTFCPLGTDIPLQCPAGRFGSILGESNPLCSGPCPQGYYCPIGSIAPTTNPCPSGTYGNITGLAANVCSGNCSAGWFCPEGTAQYNLQNCGNVAVYCPAATKRPIITVAGYYSVCPTADENCVDAKICPAGFSCVGGIRTSCIPGQYQPRVGMSKCERCVAGQYTPVSNSTAFSLCPPGWYQPSGGADACYPCQPGSVNPKFGASSCTACPRGSYAPVSNSTVCTVCPAGTVSSTTGSSACVACPLGTFAPDDNSATCFQCPSGTYASQVGSVRCAKCPTGNYAPGPGLATCFPCQAGTFANETGLSTCYQCQPGFYQDAIGAPSCSQCQLPQVSRAPGAIACVPCNAGTRVLMNRTDCLENPCKAGMYWDTDNSCKPCSVGTRSNAGAVTCVSCSSSEYNTRNGSAVCFSCSNIKGLTCVRGLATVNKGYYAIYSEEGEITTTVCPYYLCPGQDTFDSRQCANKRSNTNNNLLCARCESPYADWGGQCVECDGVNVRLIILTVIISFCLTLFLYISSLRSAAMSAIFLNFAQSAILISGDVGSWLNWASAINSTPQSLGGGSTGGCLAPLSAYHQMVLSLMMLPILLAELAVLLGLHYLLFTSEVGKEGGRLRRMMPSLAKNLYAACLSFDPNMYVRAAVAIADFTYIQICSTCFSYLSCTDVGSSSLVYATPSMDCKSSEYKYYLFLVCVYLALYVVGYPIWSFIFLFARLRSKWPEYMQLSGAETIKALQKRLGQEEKLKKQRKNRRAPVKPIHAPHERLSHPVFPGVSPRFPLHPRVSVVGYRGWAKVRKLIDDCMIMYHMRFPALNAEELRIKCDTDKLSEYDELTGVKLSRSYQRMLWSINQLKKQQEARRLWQNRWGIFLEFFAGKHWYWYSVTIIRRVAMVAIDAFMFEGGARKFMSFGYIFLGFLTLQMIVEPYVTPNLNLWESVAMLFLVIISMLITAHPPPYDFSIQIIIFCLIIPTSVVFIGGIIWTEWKELQHTKKRMKDEEDEVKNMKRLMEDPNGGSRHSSRPGTVPPSPASRAFETELVSTSSSGDGVSLASLEGTVYVHADPSAAASSSAQAIPFNPAYHGLSTNNLQYAQAPAQPPSRQQQLASALQWIQADEFKPSRPQPQPTQRHPQYYQ